MSDKVRQHTELQLPYPAPLPSWTGNAHPCVVPRPFLTPHNRLVYATPRLFPVQLSALPVCRALSLHHRTPIAVGERIHNNEPCHIHTVAPAVPAALLDSLCQQQEEEEALEQLPSRSTFGPRNAMCAVNDGDNGAPLVALTTTGQLHDVALWKGTLLDSDSRDLFTRMRPASRAIDNNQVFDLVAADDIGQGGLLAARLSHSLALARYESGGQCLKWHDNVNVPAPTRAVALNAMSMAEMCALDRFALRVYDINSGLRESSETELQPLGESFSWMRYAAHPRTLLLCGRRNIVRVDLRESNGQSHPLLDVCDGLSLSRCDDGVQYFSTLNNFRSVLATESQICVIDQRMPRAPLLEWHFALGHSSNALGACITTSKRDIIIALADPASATLAVLHATRGHRFSDDLSRPTDLNAQHGDARLQHPQLLWSDVPLTHLDRFGPRGATMAHGLALACHPGASRVSLLQAVPGCGVISQLLGVDTFENGTHCFERPVADDVAKREIVGVPHDSIANIINQYDANVANKIHGKPLKHSLRKRKVGRAIAAATRLRRLDARDALLLQSHIL